MCLQKEIDNRLIQVVPANTPLTADLACIKLSERFPNLSHENLQEVVPVRLRTLSDVESPLNTDMPYRYFKSAEGAECYFVNTSSVAWREAHPEYVPHRDIHSNCIDIDCIITPPGMCQQATAIYVRDIYHMANPEFRNKSIRINQMSNYVPSKRRYVSNRWKIASHNPHLRIPVINIIVALDRDNSWIKALLEELTVPSDGSPDNNIALVAPFEVSYIAIPPFFRTEADRRRAIGYLVLLKCMEDSPEVKNKVIETLIDWEKPRYQKIFINTMKAIATCICDRQISQLFDDLSPHISWVFLIRKVMA